MTTLSRNPTTATILSGGQRPEDIPYFPREARSSKYVLFQLDHTTVEVPCTSKGATELMEMLRARFQSCRSEHQAAQLDVLDHRLAVTEGDIRRAQETLNLVGLPQQLEATTGDEKES
uniref:Uncharacterized protein n=1 Tax=Mycena chlorophos TaxID=658473 RepID=A0ABQ0L3T4_MYCCL|nr:predicted protein [Mycena chlorophos]